VDHYRPTRYPRDSKQQRHYDQTIARACSSNLPSRTSSHIWQSAVTLHRMAAFGFTCDAYGSLNSLGEMGNGVRALLSTHQMTGFCPRTDVQNDLVFWVKNYLLAALAAATILSKRLSPRESSQHGLKRRVFAIQFRAGVAKARPR
jgi:hypothetical protein